MELTSATLAGVRSKGLALADCLCLVALLAALITPTAGESLCAILAPVATLSAPASVPRPAMAPAAAPPALVPADPIAARAPPLA